MHNLRGKINTKCYKSGAIEVSRAIHATELGMALVANTFQWRPEYSISIMNRDVYCSYTVREP